MMMMMMMMMMMESNAQDPDGNASHHPNPALNEEERALLDADPEECLRRATQRGALSIDEVTAALPPRLAAVVQNLTSGERHPAQAAAGPPSGVEPSSAHSGEPPSLGLGGALASALANGPAAGVGPQMIPWSPPKAAPDQDQFSAYPGLQHMLDEGAITPAEATQAIHAIERMLGRYLTGTLYAAP